jgi:hypothetical protein
MLQRLVQSPSRAREDHSRARASGTAAATAPPPPAPAAPVLQPAQLAALPQRVVVGAKGLLQLLCCPGLVAAVAGQQAGQFAAGLCVPHQRLGVVPAEVGRFGWQSRQPAIAHHIL